MFHIKGAKAIFMIYVEGSNVDTSMHVLISQGVCSGLIPIFQIIADISSRKAKEESNSMLARVSEITM